MLRACSIVLFVFFSLSAFSATFDPQLEWLVTPTEHFTIAFHQGEEHLAQRAAGQVEKIYERITAFLGHRPKGKTYIIIADISDEVIGYALAIPYRKIMISPTPPSPFLMGANVDDWLKLVLTHEFTHVVQSDMSGGIPLLLRYVFGDLFLTNGLQPLWQTEGLAVYTETKFASGGRAGSTLYQMMLRTAVHENRILGIDRTCNYYLIDWPDGTSPYLYGSSLVSYVSEKYGPDRLAAINHDFKKRFCLLPFFGDSYRRAVGKGDHEIYFEWRDHMIKKYTDQIQGLRAEGLTAATRLTKAGYLTGAPTWFPTGKGIAYIQTNVHQHPQIRLRSFETGQDVKLKNILSSGHVNSIDISPSGSEIIYSEIMPYRLYYTFSDLYVYDFATHAIHRLTEGERAADPCWSPDGEKVVYVKNEADYSNLYTMDRSGGNVQALTTRTDCRFSHPSWSPEGNRVAVSAMVNGCTDIYYMKMDRSDSLYPVTADPFIDLTPAWSPDGKYILYSSDLSGVFNLYAYNTRNVKTHRLTNTVSGAFAPAMSPDGRRIAYTGYSAVGYDVFMMDISDALLKETPGPDTLQKGMPASRPEPPPPAPAPLVAKKYSPLSTVFPRFWLPYAWPGPKGWQPGLTTLGQDLLALHTYSLTLFYGYSARKLSYNLGYTYGRYWPVFAVSTADFPVSYRYGTTDTGGTVAYRTFWQQGQAQEVSVTLPGAGGILSRLFYTDLTLGIKHHWYHNLSSPPTGTTLYHQPGHVTQAYLAYNLSTYNYFLASVSPEDGFEVGLKYAFASRRLGSDLSFRQYYARVGLYKQLLFPHHVLSGHAAWDVKPGDLTAHLDLGTLPFAAGWTPERAKLLLGARYRFPILYLQRGLGSLPLFLQKMHGGFFYDLGVKNYRWDDYSYSWGGLCAFDLVIFHGLPVSLQAYYVVNRKRLYPFIVIGNIMYNRNQGVYYGPFGKNK